MFRGGDYVDDPRFSNPNQIKNTMDVSVSQDVAIIYTIL
jgi:hypothetical protein